jgi:ParB-like chromosome segregation protein Spo0J
MSERRGFKDQISDVLTESLPDPSGGTLERWLAPTTESRIEQIPVEQVRERALRGEVDVTEPTYRALRASIRASGVLQPLLLRPHPEGGYEVVSGARRLRAARDTAQATVPAVVRELNDVQALVGGSWDAVLRAGLTAAESRDLVAQLVGVGMGEGEAAALVATAPVREGDDGAEAPVSVADDADGAVAVEAAAPVVDEAAAVEEAPVVDEAAAVEDSPVVDEGAAVEEAPVVDEAAAVEEAPVVDEAAAVEDSPVGEAAAVEDSPVVDEAAVVEETPAVEEAPAAEAASADGFDVDEDSLGWPAPGDAPIATAPTSPPTSLPVDPTPFPVSPLDSGNGSAAPVETEPVEPAEPASNGSPAAASHTAALAAVDAETNGTAATPAEGAPEATVEPPAVDGASAEAPAEVPAKTEPVTDAAPEAVAEPDAGAEPDAVAAPEAIAEPDAAAEPDAVAEPEALAEPEAVAGPEAPVEPEAVAEPAVVVAPTGSPASEGATPHVIRINLPDAATAVADESEAAAAGTMPVAAPAGPVPDVEPGSRLVATAEPAPQTEAPDAAPARSSAVPSLLRRGPLFYAVLGIGLAVGAIVFILTSVLEGVGGTTSIIAAVVVAVVGFVTAMVSLAQPRPRA